MDDGTTVNDAAVFGHTGIFAKDAPRVCGGKNHLGKLDSSIPAQGQFQGSNRTGAFLKKTRGKCRILVTFIVNFPFFEAS